MRNIILDIQYDGTNYNGWQIQSCNNSNIITVQGVLMGAIYKLTGQHCEVTAAGRTDAGVHALSQIASFKTSSGLKTEIIQKALNANLPYDIRILEVIDKDMAFNPRFDAKSKVYCYLISNLAVVSPFVARYSWNIPYKLDIDAMISAVRFLIGKHDFSSFRGSGCGAKNTQKTLLSISIEARDKIDFMTFLLKGNFIKISVGADSFLRHMVRNLVGTISEVGRKRWKPEDMEKILSSKDRRLAGQTAPARGLFLEKIIY